MFKAERRSETCKGDTKNIFPCNEVMAADAGTNKIL